MPDAALAEVEKRAARSGLVLALPIAKIDQARREVWGFATTEAIDQQGEIVDFEASKEAFGEWTDRMNRATQGASLGNVREMHQPKAVGKLIAWQPDEARKGIWIGAKISESADGEEAWKKVNEGVLNGFSIGAPTAERRLEVMAGHAKPVNRVIAYKLSEVSLVDNPACPEAFISEIKLAKVADGPQAMALVNAEVLTRFEEADPRPPAEKPKAAPASAPAKKGLEANAFVDGDGQVWKLEGGRVQKGADGEELHEQPPGAPGYSKQDGRPPTTIQTIIFSKERFATAEDAKAWAGDHEFKAPEVDETDESFRLRQRDPGDFAEGSMRTIELDRGIQAVIGHLKGDKAAGAEASALAKFVSGLVYGHVFSEGKTMSDAIKTAAEKAAAEKAGKKIGPNQRTAADPPGAQKPKAPAIEAPPEPPKPAKAAGPHDDATDEDISVPEGQGKAADGAGMPEGHSEGDGCPPGAHGEAAPAEKPCMDHPGGCPAGAHAQPGGLAAAKPRYGYCAMCGQKLGEAEAMGNPYHKVCMDQEEERQRGEAEMGKRAAAGLTGEGLAKIFEAATRPLVEAVNKNFQDLSERMKRLEESPAPGGPKRMELPQGVHPVQKGGGAAAAEGQEAALEKTVHLIEDPHARDLVGRQLAKAAILRQRREL